MSESGLPAPVPARAAATVPQSRVPSLAARLGIHYGWVVTGVAFLAILAATGTRSASGLFIEPLEEEFGWSRGEISLALALSILALGAAGPVSGMLNDRFGIRRTMMVFLAVSAAGVALSSTTQHFWQFVLFWGVLVGFGIGGVSTVLSASLANAWFVERRGLVTGLLGGSSSAGQFIFLPALIVIMGEDDWRSGMIFLTAMIAVVVLPVCALLIRSRPQDVGLLPVGSTRANAAALAADTRVTPMREALRTGDFWLLSSSFFICGFTTIGLVGTHFIPHASEHGFSRPEAAGLLTVMGAMNIVGTIGSGILTDRFHPRKLLAVYYALRAGSLLVLPLITTLPLMSLFAVVFGLDFIATVPPTVMLTANRFGRRSVGTIYGWISFSHMVGGAGAALFAGEIHDVAGDYAAAIYIGGFLALIAASLAFNIRPERAASKLAPAAA